MQPLISKQCLPGDDIKHNGKTAREMAEWPGPKLLAD